MESTSPWQPARWHWVMIVWQSAVNLVTPFYATSFKLPVYLYVRFYGMLNGMSEKFGQSYQKTSKTKDTNKFSLFPFKIVAIRYNTRLITFAQLPQTISKDLLWNRSLNDCHTIFMAFTSAKRASLMAAFLYQHLSHFFLSFLGFCSSMADPNMVHPQSFPSLR